MTEYTIEDIVSSKESEVVEVPWKNGKIEIQITPITFGELGVLRKKVRDETGDNNWDLAGEIFTHCVEKKVIDEDTEHFEEMSKEEMKQLPPGLVTKIMREINSKLGLETEVGELQNLSNQTMGQGL